MKKTILGSIFAVLALGGLILIARPSSESATAPEAARSTGALTAEESGRYDFGAIRMSDGTVTHRFKFKNIGMEAVAINALYTSCMCTTATLTVRGAEFGPYGMAGHGIMPKMRTTVDPNEEADVLIAFDPAAHGPAGVGRIQRTITLENNAGRPLEFLFTATVTP